MIALCDVVYAVRNLLRTLWHGAAMWGIASIVLAATGGVVIFMRPEPATWCVGPGYVQAAFHGYKVRRWWPVAGSVSGNANFSGIGHDVHFEFVDDPTPASAKPTGWRSFGLWRWYASTPESVGMTMRHTDGSEVVLSTYGPFRLPSAVPDCAGQ